MATPFVPVPVPLDSASSGIARSRSQRSSSFGSISTSSSSSKSQAEDCVTGSNKKSSTSEQPSSTPPQCKSPVIRTKLNGADSSIEYSNSPGEQTSESTSWEDRPSTPTVLGYEVMEERAKFTVYKVLVRKSPEESWVVFRRYTDFSRLNDKVNVKKETVKCGGNTCTSYPCTYHGCNGKELLPVVCTHCEKHFCLAHRHQDAHECEKLEVPKPRMAATQQLVKEIVESKKSAPARGRRGTERTYFQVFLPKGGTEKSKPIFFCSKWSVGKVVDYAASLANLKNNNNILTAKKLRLCHPLSGEALQMDSTLESWVCNTECPLYNGGNVILEYLDNDCKGIVVAMSTCCEMLLLFMFYSIRKKFPFVAVAIGFAVNKQVIVRNCVLLYFSFIGEESVAAGESSILTDNPTWIIDPIDGTTNFVHRFPFVAVSIGFAVKKELEFGVVYSCMDDKMYTARKGRGAFCNGVQLKVSGQEDITKSLIITELGSNRNPDTVRRVLANMDRLLCVPVHGIRAVGTAAVNMCLVATGGADAYYEIGIHCWDMAAAAVIVTEAGGVVMDVTGGPFDLMSRRLITASSRAIGERIAKELQAFPCERDDGKKEDQL
ncbi:Inositol monophosphatase 1 [Acipenser ruthenus]|uniref:Inositol monophosphatase 1 n=1 Tax=Acipenser ruthenus TaxID=7906 RepID=A0A662YZ01_ACIRT|nr:Inositol monophosphatase 1 [Acipenser ruthenus]